MAGFLTIKDLQTRKRALVAESELYRQTMMIEVQNLRLHGAQVRRRFMGYQTYAPLVKFGPVLWGLLRLAGSRKRPELKRTRSKFRWIAGAIGAWNLYRRFAPLLAAGLAFMRSRKRAPKPGVEPSEEPLVSAGRV